MKYYIITGGRVQPNTLFHVMLAGSFDFAKSQSTQPLDTLNFNINRNMIEQALKEWSEILGSNSIELTHQNETFDDGIVEISPKISPKSEEEVREVLRIASKYKVPLHPISSGKNWGYGSASPNYEKSVLLDLSGLNDIHSFDRESGIIVLGPGVTQKQLYDFLLSQNLNYFVPTTGAGKECSILGNALERGYGITPYGDHFDAVMRLKVLLADGRILDGPFSSSTSKINFLHKYGIGPYLDGIFSQSSFGIVLRGAIKLKKKTESTDFFIVKILNPDLGKAVRIANKISDECGSLVSQLNIMDDHRIFASMIGMEEQTTSISQFPGILSRFGSLKMNTVGAWNIVGALYTSTSNRKFLKRIISKISASEDVNVSFVSKNLRDMLYSASKFNFLKSHKRRILALISAYDLLDGVPNDSALGLIRNYSKIISQNKDSIPLKDLKVGLRWFAPLIPNQPDEICNFVKVLRGKFKDLNLKPLITLTRLDNLHYDASIPLMYNSELEGERERIDLCLEELNKTFIEIGFEPYRLGVKNNSNVISEFDQKHWQLIKDLKKFFDPDEIISRGRYY